HIDDDLAFGKPFGDAVFREQHLVHVGRVGHHGKNDFGLLRDLLAGPADDRVLVDQLLRQLAAAPDKKAMTGGLQMPRHRATHDAETDESKIGHELSSLKAKTTTGYPGDLVTGC